MGHLDNNKASLNSEQSILISLHKLMCNYYISQLYHSQFGKIALFILKANSVISLNWELHPVGPSLTLVIFLHQVTTTSALSICPALMNTVIFMHRLIRELGSFTHIARKILTTSFLNMILTERYCITQTSYV